MAIFPNSRLLLMNFACESGLAAHLNPHLLFDDSIVPFAVHLFGKARQEILPEAFTKIDSEKLARRWHTGVLANPLVVGCLTLNAT